MIKKPFYTIFLLLLLAGSFMAGSWFNRGEPRKSNPSSVESVPVGVTERPDTDAAVSSLAPGTVKIAPSKQQIMGIRIETAEKEPVTHKIRILGRVAADETRIYRINASVNGWITEAFPNATGNFVKKDETLATFSSQDFLSVGQSLFIAMGSQERAQTTGGETQTKKDQVTRFSAAVRQSRIALRNLGMGDLQIDEMIRTHQIVDTVNISSPGDGFILARNVSKGQRFDRGTELYRIADLSRVWILTDTFENEAQYLQPGKTVTVSIPNLKKTFRAKVSHALPQVDPNTRTLKVRLEADNPGYLLKPGMFVDVELPVSLPPAITVPADAVLDSGLKKTIFIDQGGGLFEPREVDTGWRMGNRVAIVRGLEGGERIVTSGTFLIDSESKLEAAAQGMFALGKDPVCRAEVSLKKAEKAGRQISYGGKTYYFCSDECQQQFAKESSRFIKVISEETSAETAPSSKALEKSRGHNHS